MLSAWGRSEKVGWNLIGIGMISYICDKTTTCTNRLKNEWRSSNYTRNLEQWQWVPFLVRHWRCELNKRKANTVWVSINQKAMCKSQKKPTISTIHFWWAMWRQSRGESEWPALQQTQLKKEDWKHTWCFEKAEGITLSRDKIQKGVEVFLCVLWATQEVMGQRCSMEIY